jgi:hypothetical protein
MAQCVIDGLETVKIEEHHRHQVLAVFGFAHSLMQAVPQQDTVGQAAHGIGAREIIQPFLRLPLLRDILYGPDHADRFSVFTEGDFALSAHNALSAIGLHNPVIDAIGPLFVQGLVDCIDDGLPVIGMYRIEEGFVGHAKLLGG